MRFRWIIIGLSLAFSVYMLVRSPGEGGSIGLHNIKENINLGLDLKGGIFMQLEVDEDDAVSQFLEEQAGIIKGSLEGDEITVASSSAEFETRTITLTGVSSSKHDNVERVISDRYPNWRVNESGGNITMRMRDVYESKIEDDAVEANRLQDSKPHRRAGRYRARDQPHDRLQPHRLGARRCRRRPARAKDCARAR